MTKTKAFFWVFLLILIAGVVIITVKFGASIQFDQVNIHLTPKYIQVLGCEKFEFSGSPAPDDLFRGIRHEVFDPIYIKKFRSASPVAVLRWRASGKDMRLDLELQGQLSRDLIMLIRVVGDQLPESIEIEGARAVLAKPAEGLTTVGLARSLPIGTTISLAFEKDETGIIMETLTLKPQTPNKLETFHGVFLSTFPPEAYRIHRDWRHQSQHRAR